MKYSKTFIMKDFILKGRNLPGKFLLILSAFLLAFSGQSSAQTTCVKADFDYKIDPQTGVVKFEAKASSNAVAFVWDFGSGSSAQGSTTSHTYTASGEYKVCLTVYGYDANRQKCSVTVCKKLEIRLCNLQADFDIAQDGMDVKVRGKSSSNHAVYGYTFGDGSAERGHEAKHTYDSAGKYTICFYVKDTVTGCTAKVCKDITIRKCDLEVDFEYGQDGNDFKFRAKSNNASAKFVWDFGDGEDGTGSEIKHSYAKPGVYKVCVTAYITTSSGTARCTATVCKRVEVERKKDTCDLQARFTFELDGKTIKVKGEANEDSVLYFWSWGDGTSGHGQKAKHTYKKYGEYEVCLVVFNPKTKCKTCICRKVIIEKPCNLKADFKYRVDGAKVTFKAKSNGSNVVYGWTFGDGDSERGNPVDHKYAKSGTYKVTLIAYDKRTGCKVEVTKRIVIDINLTIPDAEVRMDADINAASSVQVEAPESNWNATAFPVPSTNEISFTSTDKVITQATIYGANGEKMLEAKLDAAANEELDITTLPTGMYYAHLTAADGSVKIVKFLKN